MAEMRIPLPLLRIVEWTSFDQNIDMKREVRFTLAFGDCPVVSRKYIVDYYDQDEYELDRRREEFCLYVADRLSTLFGEDES